MGDSKGCGATAVLENGVSEVKGGITGRRSGRQGRNPAGESPIVSIARIGYVEIPHLEVGHFNLYANNSSNPLILNMDDSFCTSQIFESTEKL